MNKALSHLPQHKRDELGLITEIIRTQLPAAQMIILFGSYARGDGWVEDTYVEDNVTYEYKSDFDILVITKLKSEADDNAIQSTIDNLIYQNKAIKTPVGIIYHAVQYVSNMLIEGQYFFTDIKNEGIMLYNSEKLWLAEAGQLPSGKRKEIAQEHFDQWFGSATEFYERFEEGFNKQQYKNAAFQLHQATERFLATVLLVFSGYRPKIHNIETLCRKASSFNMEFIKVFPRATDEQDRMFKLLKKAYVDARYKKDYEITKEQLEYLAERVQVLRELTEKVCTEKIKSFV